MTELPTPISTMMLQQWSIPSTYNLLLQTALALQHLAHVWLAVWACNQIDTCLVNPNRDIDLPTTTDLTYPQRSSSCILQLDRPQLPTTIVQLHSTTRLTSATRNNRPAAFIDSTDLSFPHTIIQLHPTTRPTSATSNDHLAASYQLDHTSYRHHPSSRRQIQLPRTLHTRL